MISASGSASGFLSVTLGDLMRAEKEDPEWYRKVPKVGAVTAGDVMRKLSDFNIR